MEAVPHVDMVLSVCIIITVSKEQVLFTFHFLNRKLWSNASNVGCHATETLAVRQTNEQMRRPDSEMQRSGGHTPPRISPRRRGPNRPRDDNAI